MRRYSAGDRASPRGVYYSNFRGEETQTNWVFQKRRNERGKSYKRPLEKEQQKINGEEEIVTSGCSQKTRVACSARFIFLRQLVSMLSGGILSSFRNFNYTCAFRFSFSRELRWCLSATLHTPVLLWGPGGCMAGIYCRFGFGICLNKRYLFGAWNLGSYIWAPSNVSCPMWKVLFEQYGHWRK